MTLIDQIKNSKIQPVKDIGSSVLDTAISKIPGLSEQNKTGLASIKDKLLSKIDGGLTIGQLVKGPGGVQNPSQKPEQTGPKIRAHQLSGWDKFKNFLSGAGEKVGLKTHKITEADYIFNPEKDKSGNILLDKDGYQKGFYKFDWNKARENDKTAGRATKTEFDPTKLIELGGQIASKIK